MRTPISPHSTPPQTHIDLFRASDYRAGQTNRLRMYVEISYAELYAAQQPSSAQDRRTRPAHHHRRHVHCLVSRSWARRRPTRDRVTPQRTCRIRVGARGPRTHHLFIDEIEHLVMAVKALFEPVRRRALVATARLAVQAPSTASSQRRDRPASRTPITTNGCICQSRQPCPPTTVPRRCPRMSGYIRPCSSPEYPTAHSILRSKACQGDDDQSIGRGISAQPPRLHRALCPNQSGCPGRPFSFMFAVIRLPELEFRSHAPKLASASLRRNIHHDQDDHHNADGCARPQGRLTMSLFGLGKLSMVSIVDVASAAAYPGWSSSSWQGGLAH